MFVIAQEVGQDIKEGGIGQAVEGIKDRITGKDNPPEQ